MNILKNLELSTKYNSNNYKAWHLYGFLNYKFYESDKLKNFNFCVNAIKGFIKSVTIGNLTKRISHTLQGLLRLIDIWFEIGGNLEIDKLIRDSFKEIGYEKWLLVLPQLLARVGVKNEIVRLSLILILKQIGIHHPRSLLFPIIIIQQSKSIIKRTAAETILNEIKKNNENLVNECTFIINELNRCALLYHEQYMSAIDEGVKLFFTNTDIQEMNKCLAVCLYVENYGLLNN